MMIKNVTYVGVGYVGLLSSLSLAKKNPNLNIVGFDYNIKKIDELNKKIPTFYEDGLHDLLLNVQNVKFTSNENEAFDNADIIFFCVNTPLEPLSGKLDISFLKLAINTAASKIKKNCIFAIKSTIPIGTTNDFIEMYSSTSNFLITFVNNPEFLAQGSATYDALHPNRIILGSNNPDAFKKIEKIYESYNCPIVTMKPLESELTKIVANCFLAYKLSFFNDISNVCRKLDISVSKILEGIKYDSRIGSTYMNPGPGYGGSCLPKDTKGFYSWASEIGYDLKSVKSSIDINENQRKIVVKITMNEIKNNISAFSNKEILFIGASFKNGTDDLRESVAIKIINDLIMNNLSVFVYDKLVPEHSINLANNKIKIIPKLDKNVLENFKIIVIFNDIDNNDWKIIDESFSNNPTFINLKFDSKIPSNILKKFKWIHLNN